MTEVSLGKTGITVNKNGFGALPIQRIPQDDAEKLVRRAFERGINFFDTARSYTDSAAKLEKQWKMYQDEKEERKQFAEAEAKIEYYQKQLVQQLAGYRVQMPERWISQTAALLDKREMVEIRHELIQRRQVLLLWF